MYISFEDAANDEEDGQEIHIVINSCANSVLVPMPVGMDERQCGKFQDVDATGDSCVRKYNNW